MVRLDKVARTGKVQNRMRFQITTALMVHLRIVYSCHTNYYSLPIYTYNQDVKLCCLSGMIMNSEDNFNVN